MRLLLVMPTGVRVSPGRPRAECPWGPAEDRRTVLDYCGRDFY